MATSSKKLDLRTICDALGSIEHKWFKIGIQLGISRNKLLQFKEGVDPFSAVIDECLSGNVGTDPLSWESIVVALKSTYVGEPGLAEEIKKNFSKQMSETPSTIGSIESSESTKNTVNADLSATNGSSVLPSDKQPRSAPVDLTAAFSFTNELLRSVPVDRTATVSLPSDKQPSSTLVDLTATASLPSDKQPSPTPVNLIATTSLPNDEQSSSTLMDLTATASLPRDKQPSLTPVDLSATASLLNDEQPSSAPNPQPPECEMHPDVKLDLEFTLESNLKKIIKKYASYVDCLRAGICKKKVSPEDLRVYLLSLHATSSNYKGQKLDLLSDMKEELESCKTIAAIFAFLTTECASFLNYEVFESIQQNYNVIDEEGILTAYPDSLKGFIKQHEISEFMKINPLLRRRKTSKELVLKYDIETTCKLAKVDELKKIIAEIMDLNPSALEIVDVGEGCVMVTFLIPISVADALFTPDTVFTPQQEQKLLVNSIYWLSCNCLIFNIKKKHKDQIALYKLKEQLTCSICLGTYTDPKQLQCQHAYCQHCLMGLVQPDQQGQPILTCPTCRQVTPVPASGVAGLQADFRANQLLEVMNEETPNHLATVVQEVHHNLAEVVCHITSVSCPDHDGKDMELFCETCEETICLKCAVKGGKHHSHDYSDLNEALDKCKSIVQVSLDTIKKALEKLDVRRDLISNQRATIEEEIHCTITDDDQKTEVISQLNQLTQTKIKSLAAQRDELETTQAQLHKHLHHMRETSSQELTSVRMSNMVKQVKELKHQKG